MVRAPCCEKMGLKKGPWTQDEDQVLINHIERFGHGNWRALPKQAGLLRCGKSCRLRWINYLRPDIKRGNFTREEDEMILSLHEMLGNRWSAIAAKLPGRTDNEIKNYWHTHLKKRLSPNNKSQQPKIRIRAKPIAQDIESRPISPSQSLSEFSSISSENTSYNVDFMKEESFSSEEIPIIDESFWSEDLSTDSSNIIAEAAQSDIIPSDSLIGDPIDFSSSGDDLDFWLRVFMGSGDMNDLPLV